MYAFARKRNATPHASNRFHKNSLVFAIGSALGTLSLSTLAAPAPADVARLDTVTVTAERKEGDLQKTPVAVTAFSTLELENKQIDSIRSLSGNVPNVFMQRTGVSYTSNSIFVRGIGESDPSGVATVALYADDIYLPRAIGANLDFNDVERVEFLRGPQGTLFGRNSSAGALQVITRDPTQKSEGFVQLGYGNYDAKNLRALASGGLTDELAGSLSVIRLRRDGTVYNATLDQDVAEVDIAAYRGKLRYQPTDKLDILLTLNKLLDRGDAASFSTRNRPDGNNSPWRAYGSIFPYNKLDQDGGSLRISYEIDPNLTFKSITAVQQIGQDSVYDNGGAPTLTLASFLSYEDRYRTQEFQLNGKYDALSFTTGLFYYYDNFEAKRKTNTQLIVPPIIVRAAPFSTQRTHSYAAFGQAGYQFTDKFSGTVGLRYTREKHDFDYTRYTLNASNDPTGIAYSFEEDKTFSSSTPRVGVEYAWTDTINQYAYVAKGFKSGGYDDRASTNIAASTPFDPEYVTAYETGLKTEWLDKRLRVNLAAFYNDYDDLQLTAFDVASNVNRRFNAGKAHTAGLETEISAALTENLQWNAAFGYLYSRYDDFKNPAGPGTDASGNHLIYAPTWNANTSISYQVPLNIPGYVRVNADYQFIDDAYTDALNTEPNHLPEQHYVNASINYLTANAHWSTTLAVKNLFDKDYIQGTLVAPQVGLNAETYNEPRTIMATVKYSWE